MVAERIGERTNHLRQAGKNTVAMAACEFALLAAIGFLPYNGVERRSFPMLNENIKGIRKSKGLTQEELAARLHVVRQTVSKWEKGLSVPDADMLIRLSEALETTVSELLGAKIETETNHNEIAEQLSRINEQLAIKNRRSKTILKVVVGVIIGILILNILLAIFGTVAFDSLQEEETSTTSSSVVVSEGTD